MTCKIRIFSQFRIFYFGLSEQKRKFTNPDTIK